MIKQIIDTLTEDQLKAALTQQLRTVQALCRTASTPERKREAQAQYKALYQVILLAKVTK